MALTAVPWTTAVLQFALACGATCSYYTDNAGLTQVILSYVSEFIGAAAKRRSTSSSWPGRTSYKPGGDTPRAYPSPSFCKLLALQRVFERVSSSPSGSQ